MPINASSIANGCPAFCRRLALQLLPAGLFQQGAGFCRVVTARRQILRGVRDGGGKQGVGNLLGAIQHAIDKGLFIDGVVERL